MSEKHAGGRPKTFTNAEDMQVLVDDYFELAKGYIFKGKDGEVVYNKYGEPVVMDSYPPTITGLALHLGFNSRTSLLNYQDDKVFMSTVTRAKARVERYAESRLFDKDGANGAKFSLANNFKSWAEKQQVEAINTNLNQDVSALSDIELEEKLQKLRGQS